MIVRRYTIQYIGDYHPPWVHELGIMDQRVYLRLGVWLDFSVIGCNWSILSRQQRLMNPLSLGGWWTSKIASHFGLWLLGFWAHFEPFSWECCNTNIRESAFLSRNFLLLTSGNSRGLALFSSKPRLSIFHISYVGQAAEAELEKLRASSAGAPVEWGENIAFVSSFMGKAMNSMGKPWKFPKVQYFGTSFSHRESGYLMASPGGSKAADLHGADPSARESAYNM